MQLCGWRERRGAGGGAGGLRRGRERRLSGESRTSFNFEVEVLGEEEVQRRWRASQAHDAVVREHGNTPNRIDSVAAAKLPRRHQMVCDRFGGVK